MVGVVAANRNGAAAVGGAWWCVQLVPQAVRTNRCRVWYVRARAAVVGRIEVTGKRVSEVVTKCMSRSGATGSKHP